MKEKEVNRFEKVQAQLESLQEEISALARKSQNDALNDFKLKFVNKVLEEANSILGTIYKPYDDFEHFDTEALPTNSDVTMILGQYLSCLEKLRSDNISRDSLGYYHWDGTDIRTSAPKKLAKK